MQGIAGRLAAAAVNTSTESPRSALGKLLTQPGRLERGRVPSQLAVSLGLPQLGVSLLQPVLCLSQLACPVGQLGLQPLLRCRCLLSLVAR